MTGQTGAVEVDGEEIAIEELGDEEPIVGAAALDPDGWTYLVLARDDQPAGEYEVEPSGVLTDFVDCPPDDSVYFAVPFAKLREKPEEWRSVEQIRDAVAAGRVTRRVIPGSELAPLPAALVDEVR